jgi:hypothetical protein
VTDPSKLQLRDAVLYSGALPTDMPLDLVYNRLTDFDLSDPAHAALAQAYTEDVVAVTPHPRAHALRANKQHLVTLGQATALQALGVSAADQQTLLATVPACERVSAGNASALWEQIQQGDYIAQALVPPPCAPTPMPGACSYWPPAPTAARPSISEPKGAVLPR